MGREERTTMEHPTNVQDAAPAYDDVVHDRFPASGSASGYAAVPQDDIELNAHSHDQSHTSPSAASTGAPTETLAQTIAGVFRPKPHVHCDQCDIQLAARERRENERHCCSMVAATFMVGFVCMMILGIIVSSSMAKIKKHGHG